ncbi:MAG: tRNA1(Val) (adenine(37)-N6)-methyltransferase [Desulfuromusa sp.]
MKETLDTLSLGNLQLLQTKDGYRYSLDPVLLARFVNVGNQFRIVDLGTGSGILPLILAGLSNAPELIGIEIQAGLAERAGRNVQINGFQNRVRILQQDIRSIRDTLPENSVDLVVSNPPYRHPDSGRIAPNGERATARHEISGGLVDFIAAARWLLKTGGNFAVIYLAERLPELMATMMAAGLEPKRLRLVHPRQGDAAKMVLVEGCKGGRSGLRIEKPLYLYAQDGDKRNYTAEVLQMYEPDLT